MSPPKGETFNPEKLERHGAFDKGKYEPIEVLQKKDGSSQIKNGLTRTENARRAGHKKIPVKIIEKDKK